MHSCTPMPMGSALTTRFDGQFRLDLLTSIGSRCPLPLLWALRPRKGRPLPSAVHRFCLTLRQGMVAEVRSVPEVRFQGWLRRRTPHGAVIISQTCDVVQRKTTAIVVATVRRLDEATARGAREGARPRFVHLPALGPDLFADLDHVATIQKTALMQYEFSDGLSDEVEQRKFAQLVGRRFSRHAFPDEISPWLTPMQSIVAKSVLRGEEALASAIGEIEELRVEAASWSSLPTDLTLHVVVHAGELPAPSDELPEPSDEVRNWLATQRSYKEVARKLFPEFGPRPSGDDRQVLWDAFGDALARTCKPSNSDKRNIPGCENAVTSVDALISSDDEFTLAMLRRSERLDLAHLSVPDPHD